MNAKHVIKPSAAKAPRAPRCEPGTPVRRAVLRCVTVCTLLLLASVALAGPPPPRWYQVNQDGFVPGLGPTDGSALFVFNEELHAINSDGWFRMEDAMTRNWTKLVPPAPPVGPGATFGWKPVGNYLYAWDSNQLWWIADGADPTGSNWTKVTSLGLPGGASPQPLTVFGGQIYGIYRNSSLGTFELWRTPDIGLPAAHWQSVVMGSFGDPTNNQGIDVMVVFNNHIYAGIDTLGGLFGDPAGYGTGVEIWESPTGNPGSWAQVNLDGFGTTFPGCLSGTCNFAIHQVIGSAAVYQAPGQTQEHLYVGTKSHFGAEVWRYDGTGLSGWVNVTPSWAGPCAFGCGPGRDNDMAVFQGDLYLAEGFPTANLAKYDGTAWSVVVDGLYPFDPDNQGLYSLAVLKGKLYVSTLHKPYAGITQGDQVWGFPFLPDLAIAKTDSPDPVVAGEQLEYTLTVVNNGPGPATDVHVVDTLPPGLTYQSGSAGCIEAASGTVTCDLGQLDAGDSVDVSITVVAHPSLVHDAGGPVTITNYATVENLAGPDPDESNNAVTEDTLVVAVADLEVVSFEAVDPPPEILVAEPVEITLRKVVANNGPSTPMDVQVTKTATAPPDSTVTPVTSESTEIAVELGVQHVVTEVFTIVCGAASHHTFTFENDIEPLNAEDTDPDMSNNSAVFELDVECVVPVAINIKPGSDPNALNLRGGIPVAVLTTAAGEYGTPLDFDATTIDPLSVRLGPRDSVWTEGGGASPKQDRGHIEDSRELDEHTRDGDLDMVLQFTAGETGIQPADTEACLKGTWLDTEGNVHKFFGCDSIVVRP